ncbi:unnamed protein product [Rotaria sp. Silwood1]|nr:unnamed protein product [Rotaria sp. Silwood1]
MRCFQYGNSLPISDKELHNIYSEYDLIKLHAHFYPTCEWIEELAYAGFYLNAAGTHVKYPWCIVELSEQRFEDIIRRRPSFPVLPLLNDEPWTAMRVHMHENEQLLDKDNSWCLWIRRKPDGHYPNVMMTESEMRYPQYPCYSSIEKRVESFQSDWIYPNGTRLSAVVLADANSMILDHGNNILIVVLYLYFYLIQLSVCPFEKHAMFHPLCDYIIQKRGRFYVERVLKESLPCPYTVYKYRKDDAQIKFPFFDQIGLKSR